MPAKAWDYAEPDMRISTVNEPLTNDEVEPYLWHLASGVFLNPHDLKCTRTGIPGDVPTSICVYWPGWLAWCHWKIAAEALIHSHSPGQFKETLEKAGITVTPHQVQ